MKDDELEFISVNQEDELNSLLNNSYADPSFLDEKSNESVGGGYILKQSKVTFVTILCKYSLSI